MTGPITRHRDIESLKTAARWPGADRNTTVILATRLAAAQVAQGYDLSDLAFITTSGGAAGPAQPSQPLPKRPGEASEYRSVACPPGF